MDENGYIPRVGTDRENVEAAPLLAELVGRGLWSQRATTVSPRGSGEVPPYPGTTGPHHGSNTLPYIDNSNNPGTRPDILRVDTVQYGVGCPPLLADF